MKAARLISLVALAGLIVSLAGIVRVSAQAQPPAFARDAFGNVWNRTDKVVSAGNVARTWFWGPQPNTPGLLEAYSDAPDGSGQRLVQYFDKSRMELNNPGADPNSPFYVTNGLLTVELISGCVQTGDQTCGEQRYPAAIPMSGDQGDQLAPTYAAFRAVSNTSAGDHPAADRSGQSVTATIDHSGAVGDDGTKATVPMTKIAYYEPLTHHNIPEAFWNFLNQSGPIVEQNRLTIGPLSSPWFYASGLPISEAYWARATIGGQVKDVMIQAYERRVLTYVPTNAPAWQVEMGNIGQHYYDWRYNFAGQPDTGTPFSTPVGAGPTYAPAPNVTPTVPPTASATATVAAGATGTSVVGLPSPPAAPSPSAISVEPTGTTTAAPATDTPPGTTIATVPTSTPEATTSPTAGTPAVTETTTPAASPAPSGTATSP